MLSYTYFNKNNIKLDKKYTEYNYIPIGCRCALAQILQKINLRKYSYPFDWGNYNPNQITEFIKNDYSNFLPPLNTEQQYDSFSNKYKMIIQHFDKNTIEGIASYERRVNRFKELLQNEKDDKIFIYFFEDSLYKNHRTNLAEKLRQRNTMLLNFYNFIISNFKFKPIIIYIDYNLELLDESDIHPELIYVNIHSTEYFNTEKEYADFSVNTNRVYHYKNVVGDFLVEILNNIHADQVNPT
jgi:hypothetical protein